MTRLPSRRYFALVGPAVAGIVLLAGCSSTMRDAATISFEGVDGEEVVHIRRDDLERDITALTENDEFMEQLRSGGFELADSASGTADAELTALWLNNLIYQVAIDAEFEARELEITDEQRTQAQQGLTIFANFDDEFRETEVERQARRDALFADLVADVEQPAAPSEEELRAFFDANAEAITACPSGVEVSHVLVETQADAEAIQADLAGGASFDEIAAARSIEAQSGAQGGSLGCLGAQAFVEEFQTAADAAPVGEVVGPVQTEFGFHLILTEEWAPTFEKYRDLIEQQLVSQAEQQVQQEQNARVGEVLNGRLEAMEVDVDGRYGSWEFDEEQQQWSLVAPEAPTPRQQRENRPTTPDSVVIPGLGEQPAG